MQYWLMKSEPDTFGIDDLKAAGTEPWDGIRNYQARNIMRDQMKVGDGVLFYHSNAKPPGVVGVAEIASETYVDPTQFDPEEKYFDAKSKPDNPRWLLLDVKYVKHFPRILSLSELKEAPGLEDMMVIRKGMRLSIQPVTAEEWRIIHELAAQDG